MKSFFRFSIVALAIGFSSQILFAQNSSPSSAWAKQQAPTSTAPASTSTATGGKIVLIDSRAFYDEKFGIQKIVSAYKQLDHEFSTKKTEIDSLQNRLDLLVGDLNKLNADSKASAEAITAKKEEGERLQRELEFKKNDAKAAYGKRERELIAPIFAQIGKSLEEFMAARGISFILDMSKMGDALLAALPSADLTKAFIDEYNAKNPVAGNAVSTR